MEGVKSKYKENTINDINIQKALIKVKGSFYETLSAHEYMYTKYSKPKYIHDYILMLKVLKGSEFISLHKALIGTFKDWISETLEQDISGLEDLKNNIKYL
jgi:hypothetical protein